MTYSKPKVTLLANALGAIQGTGVKTGTVMDSVDNTKHPTISAYEADE